MRQASRRQGTAYMGDHEIQTDGGLASECYANYARAPPILFLRIQNAPNEQGYCRPLIVRGVSDVKKYWAAVLSTTACSRYIMPLID